MGWMKELKTLEQEGKYTVRNGHPIFKCICGRWVEFTDRQLQRNNIRDWINGAKLLYCSRCEVANDFKR